MLSWTATSAWNPRRTPHHRGKTCCCRSKRSLPKRFRYLPARLDSLRFDRSQVSPQDQARCAPLLSGVDSRSGDGGKQLSTSFLLLKSYFLFELFSMKQIAECKCPPLPPPSTIRGAGRLTDSPSESSRSPLTTSKRVISSEKAGSVKSSKDV